MTTPRTSSFQLATLRREQHVDVVRLLARAYATNPMNAAAFGPGALTRNEAFFRQAVAVMNGTKVAALDGDTVVGVAHWVRSPGCQLSSSAKLRLMPTMLAGVGPSAAMRVSRWLSAWSARDCAHAHLHLGAGCHARDPMRDGCDRAPPTAVMSES